MAATAGSIYQVIRQNHINNNPPNAYPQTAFENWKQYITRMEKQGLPPDINADESDADYLVRLASYAGPVPFSAISASYALTAKTEIDPEASASYAITASYTIASGTAFTTADTASRVVGTTTAGIVVDARASTSGYGVYAQGKQSEAVAAAQTGVPTGNINRGAISATRDFGALNGYDTVAAVFTVKDNYLTGSGPLITATTVETEVFRVDKTGSLWSSGSKGFTGVVAFHDGDTNEVSMSFQGGLFVGLL